MVVGMVAYTDYIIAPVVIEMSQNGPITCQDVSNETGIPHSTVKNSLARMMSNDVLQRQGIGRKWGYIYRPGHNFCRVGDV